jgi:hypothetical protein
MNVSPTNATAPPAGIPMPLSLELQKYESVLRQQGVIQYRPDRRHDSYVLGFWVYDPRYEYRVRKPIALRELFGI